VKNPKALDENNSNAEFISDFVRAEDYFRHDEINQLAPVIIDKSPNPITIIDPDTSIKYVNPAFEKITGFLLADIFGLKPPYPWWPKESIEKLTETFIEDMSKHNILRERQFQKKNGELFWVELNSVTIMRDGKPVYYLRNWVEITQRKQAMVALEESENKFSQAFRASPNIISITSANDGKFVEINDSYTRLTGYTREETIGNTSTKIGLWPKDEDRRRMLKILTQKGRVENEEFIFRIKSGELRNWLYSTEKITFNGEPCLISMTTDITELRQTELALRESEETFSKVFQGSPDCIAIVRTKDNKFTDVNESFIKMNGYSREEVIGHSASELNLWADHNECDKIVEILQKTGRIRNEECHLRSKSGKMLIGLFSAEVVNIHGEPYAIAMTLDITERKKMEKDIRESEEKFSRAFLASPDSMTITTMEDGRYIEVNDSFTRITGFSRNYIIGKRLTDLKRWDESDSRGRIMAELKAHGSVREECKFRMKSGVIRTMLYSAEMLKIGGVDCVLSVTTDITDRKKIEDELRQHKDHLEELVALRTKELKSSYQKLEQELKERGQIEEDLRDAIKRADTANKAKSEFLARMSHEIRTPIHGVMGTLDLLNDTKLEPEQKQYVNMSKTSAETLLNVINDILDFSKIEAGKLEMEYKEFELLGVLEDSLEAIAVSAHRKGLEIILQASRGVPMDLIGDAAHLRQILINLLGNAVKFTAQGEIILRVETEAVDEKEVNLHFSVKDTGIGIPKEKEALLFRPFEQVDGSNQRKYGGTGLGLSICMQLVSLMGGRIWFKSWPGEGSVFHFTAKFKVQSTANQKTNRQEIMSELRGLPLLLVDDNNTYRSILKELLVALGFGVTDMNSGRAAIKELEDAAGTSRQYRIILLDKEMPEMNGFITAKQIQENAPKNSSIVMMLPSDNISDDFATCQELGISHFLVKPVKRSELIETITKATGKEKITGEAAAETTFENSNVDNPHCKILVAEDNPTSQLIAKKILEKACHTVQIARTGIEVIRMLKEDEFDIILMDVEMPEMSGIEATKIIRKGEEISKQHIPIVAMTAYAMKEDRQRCLDAGMDTYLSKPVNVNELHKVLKEYSPRKNIEPCPIDIETALKFVGRDKDILKEVLGVFLDEDYPEQLKKLKNGISRQDAEVVKHAAHSIKGAVRSLGGVGPGNTAQHLEEMGRNNNLIEAQKTLLQLEQEISQFKEYYARYNFEKEKV